MFRNDLFDSIIDFLVNCFNIIHDQGIAVVIKNPNFSYGITIIVFTIIIRTILLPLGIKSMKSQLKMTAIQPEIKKLQERYKKDPAKLNEETMKLYKEKGVNPLGGCLPLLVQMPVLMALYYIFGEIKFAGSGFLWVSDLSLTVAKSDPLYILAILSGATTYISSTLLAPKGDSAQAKQTSTMNIVMGGFLTFMSATMHSGLVIYWIVGNLYQIAQTIIIKKSTAKSLEEA